MKGNKSSLARILKQEYKLPPGLDITSYCLVAVIDKQWVVSTGGNERITWFSIITRNER